MRTRSRLTFLALAVAIIAALSVTAGPPQPSAAPSGTLSFAVLGDAPYYVWEEIKYRLVMQDLRAHDLRLVLHVGDIFWRPCTDARYQRSLDSFNALPHPVIYTPGDNEWADCWTQAAGEFAPLERLARLRQGRDDVARTDQVDGSALALEAHRADARSSGGGDALDRHLQPVGQPGGEQVRRWRVRRPRDDRRSHRLVRGLVQRRGEQAAPQGDPGPGQVSVAGSIGLGALLQEEA